MSSTPTKTLFEAYEHIQAGQLSEARGMLRRLLRGHPNSERGWLLMSMAVPDAPRQRECLQHVLRINPFNTEAQARLAGLSADQGEGAAEAGSLIAEELGEARLVEENVTSEPIPAEAPVSAMDALIEEVEAGAATPPLAPEPEVAEPTPPTRPSVTSILVSPTPVTSSASPVISFEPDRPAPSMGPSVVEAVPEPPRDSTLPVSEAVSEPSAKPAPEPPVSVAESGEPIASGARSKRRASGTRKRRRTGNNASEQRAPAPEPEPAPPNEAPPPAPPASTLEPVVNWQRMYEQPAAPSTPAPAHAVPPPHPRPAPPQREAPPAAPREYYDEEPWPRFMLPMALLVWAVIVIGIFFVIARLLLG